MRIGLIDVDSSNFPNLALMKLGAWHKQNGDDVEWYSHFTDRYDIVYKSKVFSFSPDFNEVINADKVIRGGYRIRYQVSQRQRDIHTICSTAQGGRAYNA